MLSSLSSVPPVWPRPRPEIIGTAAPQAASTGARISETLSPTPPGECLSSTRFCSSPARHADAAGVVVQPLLVPLPGEHGAGVAHRARERHAFLAVHPAQEERHGERAHL